MNNKKLIEHLFKNTTYKIDRQAEFNQIVFWCKTFNKSWSICFQNGDMSGNHKDTACWNNDGANCGIVELIEILQERPEFSHLIDYDTYHSEILIEELVDNFISEISKKENVDNMI